MALKKKLRTIGLEDTISFHESSIFNLPCKIDTGAHTSSVHCEKVKLKEVDGVEMIFFKLLDKTHPLYTGVEHSTSEFKEKKVTSSFGDYEFRYQVKLKTTLGGKKYNIAFNLSNRKKMKFPVLIGMSFLRNKFVVDVSKKNLLKTT
jgi:hypothetical protein